MLYWLHYHTDLYSPLRVFQYITVRAVLGAGTAFLIVVLAAPRVIEMLRSCGARQYERKEEAPAFAALHALHGKNKQGTPTMGGLLIVFAIVVSCLLWAHLGNRLVWVALAALCALATIGFLDDRAKLCGQGTRGLSARAKFALQAGVGVGISLILLNDPVMGAQVRHLMVPFFKDPVVENLGAVLATLFVVAVLVASANAVNLTDGLDGLAVGCGSTVTGTYLILAYVAGHVEFARYLRVPHVPGSGELAVFCGCMLGACFGFLWHNCHPARVFMGDTGSLALGGGIAAVAVMIKQELTLIVVGGVFVMEAVSVILQVLSFRLRGGRRIFAMAPLHHHFELSQWSETQVTVRFWILSMICALLGLLTLKIR
jgi:phospho-N-acetylmuramoyl-pentapeptide-transferase